ncbi:transglutaminase family protein [uncultured Phycicoccus sp.]|uniref:transglutaminase-like domain-containing protein n=1 Tax=uncultured Phycicoccus sp. TaxID=661422 RepID=UPI002615D5DB|nr:transglutaminase domain-containing protein [uncultured Phycicoccus sp.]
MTGHAEGPDRVVVDVALSADVETAGGLALCLAVADHLGADDRLVATGPDGPLDARVLHLPHGTRVHVVDAPTGTLTIRYTATVPTSGPSEAAPVTDVDRLTYVLPSRYCPSDRLGGWAAGQFGAITDAATRVQRVVDWVSERTVYTPGSTGPTDDALAPLLTGQGVCRDYAHLVVTACRALEIPARYVSVYAPGLSPMDAHAVVEVALEDRWYVVDATHLAPRLSMVRSGTGRDATDVALMTTLGAVTGAPTLSVTATADPDLPDEDTSALVTLR